MNSVPDITQPLRLAVGSHQAGSGRGCAMNVVSWENGDTTITDFPSCVDPFLAATVQLVNDVLCDHRDVGDLLCPGCSIQVLDLAHAVIGSDKVSDVRVSARITYEAVAPFLLRYSVAGTSVTARLLDMLVDVARYGYVAPGWYPCPTWLGHPTWTPPAGAQGTLSLLSGLPTVTPQNPLFGRVLAQAIFLTTPGGLAFYPVAESVIKRFGELTGHAAAPFDGEKVAAAVACMTLVGQ